jgi:Ribbon-helix-helix protein, copG family
MPRAQSKPCGAPSLDVGGAVLHCERVTGHLGRHAQTIPDDLDRQGKPRRYEWGPDTTPNARRKRKMITITLSDVEIERLDAHAAARGLSRSGTIASLLFRVTPKRRK